MAQKKNGDFAENRATVKGRCHSGYIISAVLILAAAALLFPFYS